MPIATVRPRPWLRQCQRQTRGDLSPLRCLGTALPVRKCASEETMAGKLLPRISKTRRGQELNKKPCALPVQARVRHLLTTTVKDALLGLSYRTILLTYAMKIKKNTNMHMSCISPEQPSMRIYFLFTNIMFFPKHPNNLFCVLKLRHRTVIPHVDAK